MRRFDVGENRSPDERKRYPGLHSRMSHSLMRATILTFVKRGSRRVD